MKTNKLGSLDVTVVGLGTNNFGFAMEQDAVDTVVDRAIEVGINFFDTADVYLASEERLGKALNGRRDQILIATKFGSPMGEGKSGGSAAYIGQAVERSLRKLDTDRIDLYQIHRPDSETPIAETLGALGELVKEGKVREIGCSNFTAEMLREADQAVADGAPKFVSVQNQYNLLHRDDESDAIPECEKLGISYLPYFPLASGLLSGKYIRGEAPPEGTRMQRWGDRAQGSLTDANFDIVDALSTWAKDHGHSVLELAIAWLAAKPFIGSVIAGATKPEQVSANAAAGEWSLSPAEVAEVESVADKAAG
ncbi:MAG TPA: aldo/keto reductase [Acidimicrobiales bacterium]|nr:aldo/keto reductase [Acidimicrobiales bacterium]